MRLGVLALQGGFEAHVSALRKLGHAVSLVRYPADLGETDGIVLPGGESSVQLDLLERSGIWDELSALVDGGLPVLATCAGVILLAHEVRSPSQKSLGRLDIVVNRNARGRQVESFEASSDRLGLPLVFIRAPRISQVGASVEIIDTFEGEPVLIRQGSLVGATFHPELTGDPSVARIAFGECTTNEKRPLDGRADPGSSRRDRRPIVDPALRLDGRSAE